MAHSSINVTEGAGKRINTWDRTVSSVLVHDQFTVPGEFPHPSYVASAYNISTGTGASHILQLMAGSSNVVRIRRITARQKTAAGTAALAELSVVRLTTAGTGGSSIGIDKMEAGDAAAGAAGMTLPSSKGTESTSAAYLSLQMSASATTVGGVDHRDEWVVAPGMKPIIIPAGTSNGIAIKLLGAVASGTVSVFVEFVETSFL